MLKGLVLSVVLVAGGLPAVAGLATANGVDTQIVLAATDQGCPGDRERCFQLTQGNLSGIEQGHGIQVVLENQGDRTHTLHVTTLERADRDDRGTPGNASFASSGRVAPGEEGKLAFHPPGYAEGVYLWCDVDGHEADGMWIEVPFGNATVGGVEAPSAEAPGPASALVGVLLLLAAAARHPR